MKITSQNDLKHSLVHTLQQQNMVSEQKLVVLKKYLSENAYTKMAHQESNTETILYL